MKRRVKTGFMTVEVAFIMPMIIGIIVLVIYVSFYIYNHCIVYQSCYLAALRGSQLQNVSDNGIEKYVEQQMEELLDQQVYQYDKNYHVLVNLSKITVEAQSTIKNDFNNIDLYEESSFDISRKAEIVRINPVTVLRMESYLCDSE